MGGEEEHGPRLDEICDEGTIRIPSEELRRLLNENARLNDQVRELHAANTALVEERRILKRGPSVVWSYGEDTSDRAAMVREFFERVVPHQERLPSPGVPSDAAVRFQSSLFFEEFVEFLEAVFDDRSAVDQIRAVLRWFLDMSPIRLKPGNLVDAADALVDVAYTAEGFLVACGIDGTALFRLVHESNLAKQNGPIVNNKRMKPAGWIPPDVAGEIRRQSLAAGRKGPEDEGSCVGRVDGRFEVKSGVASAAGGFVAYAVLGRESSNGPVRRTPEEAEQDVPAQIERVGESSS